MIRMVILLKILLEFFSKIPTKNHFLRIWNFSKVCFMISSEILPKFASKIPPRISWKTPPRIFFPEIYGCWDCSRIFWKISSSTSVIPSSFPRAWSVKHWIWSNELNFYMVQWWIVHSYNEIVLPALILLISWCCLSKTSGYWVVDEGRNEEYSSIVTY